MKRVFVIGGGLAGMTVARDLCRSGFDVILLESTDRLGGKAGGWRRDGIWIEHGYHVFPGWYRNTRALLDELGLRGRLRDITRFHILLPGEWPRCRVFYQFDPASNALRNLFSGVLPPSQMLLVFSFLMDLLGQPFAYRGFLDRVSVNGFLRSRRYASEAMAAFAQFTALQASSIHNYELSAMSSQAIGRAWMRRPAPLLSILDGNLQERFIQPFERHVRDLGVRIVLRRPVRRLRIADGRVVGLDVGGRAKVPQAGADDLFVLATPPEATRKLIDAALYRAEAEYSGPVATRLGDLVHLETAPMAALHLFFRERLPDIPAEHVNLQGSRYGLSFIDLSPHWSELAGRGTVLSFIASSFAPLADLPDEQAEEHLLGEIRRYVPIVTSERIERAYLVPNRDTPLFLNTVGSWRFRPGTRTRVPNLYVTGDYCRSEADLTTMESALISAHSTARDMIADHGDGSHPGPLSLDLAPRWIPRLAGWVALPIVAPFAVANWLRRRKRSFTTKAQRARSQ